MGGSDSKEDEKQENQKKQEDSLAGSKIIPKNVQKSPYNSGKNSRLSNNESPLLNSGRQMNNRSVNKNQSKLLPNKQSKKVQQKNSLEYQDENEDQITPSEYKKREGKNLKVQNSNLEIQDQFDPDFNLQLPQEPLFFEEWLPQFHQEGSINLKVSILKIQALLHFKKLQRKTSQHQGILSWSYERAEVERKTKLCLRIVFEEEQGYLLSFLVDEEATVIEGDQDLWNLVCPFRTEEDVSKIGNFYCEGTYNSSVQQGKGDEKELDPEIVRQWGQKFPENRTWMKQLLAKRRQQTKVKDNIGFDYRQTNKYFTMDNQWQISILIQEKNNTFLSYFIERVKEPVEGRDRGVDSTVEALRNDIQNRESMYIEEMKRKRDILKRIKKANR